MGLSASARSIVETAQGLILVVEDDAGLREALTDTLQLAGYQTLAASSAEDALVMLDTHSGIDLIVSDVNMGEMSGHDLLREVRQRFSHIPTLLITAYASIAESVQAMRDGAVDYLVKPFEPEALVRTVKRYCGRSVDDDELIAVDAASRRLLELAARIARSDSTVLLLGESGTGKEVLARYIHRQSARCRKPFVAINCAAIPENLLESTLFGHEKGAFTGATTSSAGKFEQADGGTLLLDEISEMDLGLQAKLLRVLQEREVERLGGRHSIKLDVRVIATSNREIRRQVAEGRFREDLYFRLSVLPLQWAPLRDRPGDILPLAERFLARHSAKQHRRGVRLGAGARNALMDYAWPGNVRELDNTMQRALILQPGDAIEAHDLGLYPESTFSAKPSILSNQEQVTVLSVEYGSRPAEPGVVPEPGEEEGLDHDLRHREFEIIVKTLRQERGSKKKTADRLGVSPRTLRYKLARLRELGYDLDTLTD